MARRLVVAPSAERTLARVLTHRAWVDQRRGWRFTNPNLEELGLVHADYLALNELDTAIFGIVDALDLPTEGVAEYLDNCLKSSYWQRRLKNERN